MATKAKSTSKARSAKTTRPASGAAARTSKKSTVAKTRATVAQPATKKKSLTANGDVTGSQVLGEIIGTFLLVTIVAATGGNAFLIGLGLIVIVMMLFNISGSHVNPALTFGLFAMRKISLTKTIFYWMAQFVGAIAAILATYGFAQTKLNISISNFTEWHWAIFAAEAIGGAIFMFGVASALNRGQTDAERGLGIGLALFVALLVSSSMLQQAAGAASARQTDTQNEQDRILRIEGTTVNPAVALSLNEVDMSNYNPLTGQPNEEDSTAPVSRLTGEVILGTLLGAAVGGRLYTLLASRK